MDFTVNSTKPNPGNSVEGLSFETQASDRDDFVAVAAGWRKLRYRQYHRDPLSTSLSTGCDHLVER